MTTLNDPIALTLQLCRVPSLTGEEAAVIEHVGNVCAQLGLTVKLQEVGASRRCNLLAHDPSTPPEVLLTTHLDTVPPFIAPTEEADLLAGRGTCDAKGAAAAMLCALQNLRAAGETRVGVMFLVGEEAISDGAKAAVNGFAPRVRYFINGEPTQMKLARAQKGTFTFKLGGDGIACHSAYPELGRSAIHALVHAMHGVITEPWPSSEDLGETTVNIGLMSGGLATNSLAPSSEARGIFRLAVPLETVEKRLRALMPPHVSVEKLGGTDPILFHVPPGEPSDVVRFGSDVPYLLPMGTPLMLGPGSIHDAHTLHEHVRKADLVAATDKYAALVRHLLAS